MSSPLSKSSSVSSLSPVDRPSSLGSSELKSGTPSVAPGKRSYPYLKAAALLPVASSLGVAALLSAARVLPILVGSVGTSAAAFGLASLVSVVAGFLVLGFFLAAYKIWDHWSSGTVPAKNEGARVQAAEDAEEEKKVAVEGSEGKNAEVAPQVSEGEGEARSPSSGQAQVREIADGSDAHGSDPLGAAPGCSDVAQGSQGVEMGEGASGVGTRVGTPEYQECLEEGPEEKMRESQGH